jgi:hypothetical protein
LAHYGLRYVYKKKEVQKFVGEQEKRAITGSIDVLVQIFAPLAAGFLNRHDIAPYTATLKKVNALIQSPGEIDPTELNICCIELFESIFKDMQHYKPVIVEVLNTISQSEQMPISESSKIA